MVNVKYTGIYIGVGVASDPTVFSAIFFQILPNFPLMQII